MFTRNQIVELSVVVAVELACSQVRISHELSREAVEIVSDKRYTVILRFELVTAQFSRSDNGHYPKAVRPHFC